MLDNYVVTGLGEADNPDLSMILLHNFPTLVINSSLNSTSNHVSDLLSLNAFVNLFSF